MEENQEMITATDGETQIPKRLANRVWLRFERVLQRHGEKAFDTQFWDKNFSLEQYLIGSGTKKDLVTPDLDRKTKSPKLNAFSKLTDEGYRILHNPIKYAEDQKKSKAKAKPKVEAQTEIKTDK